jgi:uncharacterized protein YeaO (DUF488 family)
MVPIPTSISQPRFISYEVEPWPAVMPWGLLDVTDPDVFRRKYRDCLHQRTPRVLAELVELLAKYTGWDLALCCFEKPGEFCNRSVLGEWIAQKTGEEVRELSPARGGGALVGR